MTETPKQHMWFYTRQSLLHGGEQGPYTEQQILELAKLGKIKLDTLLRSPTKTNNQKIWAESIPKLASAINQAEIETEAKGLADRNRKIKEMKAIADQKQNAKKDWKAEYKRIAEESGDDMFFTRKELNHLPEILGQGERLLAFSSGLMDGNTWLISLTNRRIIFLDKGMIYGLRQSSIDLTSINAISAETGILFGTIKIQNGASERKITMVLKGTITIFTNKVRDAIEATKVYPIKPMAQEDAISKLERLSVLKEKGVLSLQEFEIEKAKILATNE